MKKTKVDDYEFLPLGDTGITVKLGHEINLVTHEKVQAFSAILDKSPFPGLVEYVPGFTTVTILYDPFILYRRLTKEPPYEQALTFIKQRLTQLTGLEEKAARIIQVPVCYGGPFGCDLEDVAIFHGLTPEEVIQFHTSPEYIVYMIGFAPGFAYLGGMVEQLVTPRRNSPRVRIPAGSVGIGGKQTGVYPIESPGGWQLIGRTPLPFFEPYLDPPCLLRAGDRIRFFPISNNEFESWGEKHDEH